MPFSFLNGLGQMGASVAQFAGNAGLELQKSQLSQQAQILADQLATARETKLQDSRQTFQSGENTKQQAFQSGENTQNRTATATNLAAQIAAENQRSAASNATTLAANAATQAGAMARTQAEINKPTETERLFKFLKINPDGSPMTSDTPSPSATVATPAVGTSGDATGGTSTPDPSASSTASGASGAASGAATPGASSSIGSRLVEKALGMPMSGSPEASRYAIAQDVNADPAFKYKTAGQKASEIEQRVAVAEGKMTDPASREVMAHAIASYQKAPLDNMASMKPGGPETMSRALEINPDYQEARYPEINKAMSAFGSGKQGDIIRSLNVGVQHLDVLDQAATALANGNVNAVNSLKNTFQQQFGSPAPTTFDGLKQIVGTEIEKAVAGGIGASGDRERLQAALDRARSPAQLQAMTDGFRGLMAGQLVGLKQQYEEATGFKGGPFAFESKLVPATTKAIGAHAGAITAPAMAPADPGAREVNKSYTLPNGKPGVWRGTGWEVTP